MSSKMLAIGLTILLSVATLVEPAPPTVEAAALPATTVRSLESQVESYLSRQEGTFGVAAVSLNGSQEVFLNADTLFPAASLYKVLVMYRVFQAIDRGDLSPGDTMGIRDSDMAESEDEDWYPGDVVTVSEALHAMITASSNVAAYALTRQIDGWGAVTSAAGELGMYRTTLDGGGFWTTPRDVAHFFRLLADRRLVSRDASEQMIDILLQQTVNDRLPALLPGAVQVAHKTGELDDVRHDGGIIRGPGGRYVVVLMGWSEYPDDAAWTEATLSQMIYQQLGA